MWFGQSEGSFKIRLQSLKWCKFVAKVTTTFADIKRLWHFLYHRFETTNSLRKDKNCSMTFKYISVQFSTFHCNLVHFRAIQFISVHFSAIQYISVQFSTFQYIAVQFSTVQCTVQFISIHLIIFQLILFYFSIHRYNSVNFICLSVCLFVGLLEFFNKRKKKDFFSRIYFFTKI